MDVVIGIDTGTTATKGVAATRTGVSVGSASAERPARL